MKHSLASGRVSATRRTSAIDDIIMGDAARPQGAEQRGRRVRLHRIERPARKLLDEETGGAGCGLRTNERYPELPV